MSDRPEEKRGSSGPRAIAEMTARLTRRSLGKRGFTESALIAEWPAVVGSLLGTMTLPLRIAFARGERSGGTLHIRVSSGAMATQLQHQEPLIVQRINGYFGYGAIARLAIVQGPVAPRPVKRPPPPPELTTQQEDQLTERLSGIDDPELKSVLAALGRHLAARR
ncbi:MAG TPA: DciA family protein [Telmatospirillum sp.]|nr:DciA family protein [Telmatospirillum sp.]